MLYRAFCERPFVLKARRICAPAADDAGNLFYAGVP
jgi:hypothetical protein